MPHGLSIVLAIAILAIAVATTGAISARHAGAETVRPDGTITVPVGDVHIANAIKEARARLPEFLALARKPDPSMHTFAVKLAIPTNVGDEYIWISPFEVNGDDFIGRISNTPRGTKAIKQGQRLKFKSADIVDWTYHHNGRRKGNFTARAIARLLPPAEVESFLRELNFDPDH